MFTSQDRNSFSSKDKFGSPRLQSGWNLIAILGPLFSIYYCKVSYNVSGTHLVDLLR